MACRRPGCAGVVRDGVCSVCGDRKRSVDGRASAAARGYGRRWRTLRRMKLQANPLCEECLLYGRAMQATDVDHMQPRAAGGSDAWENLRSLCHSCHSKKTASEGRGYKISGS